MLKYNKKDKIKVSSSNCYIYIVIVGTVLTTYPIPFLCLKIKIIN